MVSSTDNNKMLIFLTFVFVAFLGVWSLSIKPSDVMQDVRSLQREVDMLHETVVINAELLRETNAKIDSLMEPKRKE